MAKAEFDLVVIGGGSGGLVAAAGAAALGAKVALVEKHRLGGDCLWTGCVPSKSLIKSARIAHEMREAARWAITPADPKPDLARVMQRVADVIAGIAPHDSPERFESLGVHVILGTGRFVGHDAFTVNGRTLTARAFVLAMGSRPAVPPIPGLAEVPYLTNETVFHLREPVPSLVVLGGGPIGCELAQALRRLGSEVTVADIAAQILPQEDPDMAAVVRARMEQEGVAFAMQSTLARVEGNAGALRLIIKTDGRERTLAASHLLVAVGRKPNIEDLDLAAAGVESAKGRLVVNARLQTSNARIFAVGDVAGSYQFTHLAEHHAGIVLRHALFHMAWAKPSPVVPWCTYTDPELARVGLSETEVRAQSIDHRVYRFDIAENDRARTESDTTGFAKLITDPRGRIMGASIVGAHAGDLIGEYALAMQQGLKASAVSGTIHPYPTWAQTNRRVADQRLKASLSPSGKRWLQRIFQLRGA
ncbi:MAG: FAD-dependent oxidoreductase [Betaproteobacteria bacterium]